MICIPISADTNERMLALIGQAELEPGDLYEYRFDAMKESPLVELLIGAASRPVMATCRSVNEGGGFRGGFAERRSILRRASLAGAAYVDSEASDLASLEGYGNAVRIISMHDFDKTPDDLDYRISALAATPADWVKFAVTARSHADNLKVFEMLARCPKPAIAIAMGEMGVVSRILGPRFGSRVTFGSLGTGLESAPGQLTATDMAHQYRVNGITARTHVCGFLGHPEHPDTGHTVHNRAFVHAGMDAVCIPFFVRDAAEFLSSIPDGVGLRHLAIDERHAAAALAWAGDATAGARRAGKASVLVNMNGHWLADYTESFVTTKSVVMRNMALSRLAR